MKHPDLTSALSIIHALIAFTTFAMSAQDVSENDRFKVRDATELSKFEDFSQDNGNENEYIRTTAAWETELFNSDGYDNDNYAMFKYGDVIYVYGFYWDHDRDKTLHFRRFNALTGEQLKGDDDSNISKIAIPANQPNIGWPYETKSLITTSYSGSWLRFFTDDKGEIGLVSFIRDKTIKDNANYIRISVGALDIESTFQNNELIFKDSPRYYDFDIAFLQRENFVSELFNVHGTLDDNSVAFDFIVLKQSGKSETYDEQWFHFDQSNSEALTANKLIFSNETRTNIYDPYTISPVDGGQYVINSPWNGANLITPAGVSDRYEFSCAWELPAVEDGEGTESRARIKNYCFVPITIADEEYYITSGKFPVMSEPSSATIDGEKKISFSLRRWRDKSDFSNLNEVLSLPSGNAFEYSYFKVINDEQQYKMVATISQKCVVEYQYKTTQASGETLTRRPKAQNYDDWLKTICYLYSPSAGIGRYEFEPVSNGGVTGIGEVEAAVSQAIHLSGARLWIDSRSAPLRIYNATGAVVFQSENCSEANLGFLAPGCYIVSWGTGLRKIILN